MTMKTFVQVLPAAVIAILLVAGCEDPANGIETGFTDDDLYFAWSSACLSAGPDSYRIHMTFASDGSFERLEETWVGDSACSGGPTTTDTISKTHSLHGPSDGDADMKLLQYLDNAPSTVFALYRVTGTTLEIAEDAAAYPMDLTGAISLSR